MMKKVIVTHFLDKERFYK